MGFARAHLPHAMLVALAAAAASVVMWWTHPPDPVEAIRDHWAPLAQVERRAAPDLGARYERWRILDQRGDSANAVWRCAPSGAERPWTVVVLGGLRTGDRSVHLIPEKMPVHVLSMDWPWAGERRAGLASVALRAPAVRRSIFRSPAVVALGIDAAARQPEVEPRRIALVGASLGAPPALASLRLTAAPAALVLLYGSARLDKMIEIGLRRIVRPTWLGSLGAGPLAALCDRLIRPLEPALQAEAAAGIPTLILGAEADMYVPTEGVEALRAAIPQAVWAELPGSHLMAHDRAGGAMVASRVAAWLDTLDADVTMGRPGGFHAGRPIE